MKRKHPSQHQAASQRAEQRNGLAARPVRKHTKHTAQLTRPNPTPKPTHPAPPPGPRAATQPRADLLAAGVRSRGPWLTHRRQGTTGILALPSGVYMQAVPYLATASPWA